MDNRSLLDDLGSALGQLLQNQQNAFDPNQRDQLQSYHQQINQFRGNPQALNDNPDLMDGMLGNIIRIAGPLLAGYATHKLLERMGQQGGVQGGPFDQSQPAQGSGPFDRSVSSGGPFDRSTSGPFDQSAGYTSEQDNVQRRSTPGGQSDEEG